MTDTRTLQLPGVGPVKFERSHRAKHIGITVNPSGVRVAVPGSSTFTKAEEVAKVKLPWIRSKVAEMERLKWRLQEHLARSGDVDEVVAREHLATRLEELATSHGLEYNRVTFRRQTTRWGSCSSENNLSLNLKLMRLPQELRDYILLHELVHTRVKGHGRVFWDELERYLPGAKSVDRRLKAYQYCLF